MAIERDWQYASNTFLSVTTNSYRLAVRISTFHLGALINAANGGDPFFTELRNVYAPVHQSLSNSYDEWLAQGGAQQGETLNVEQLLRLLQSTNIRQWDVAIQVVYDITTEEYKKLLPNNRNPFQKGGQTDRLSAVEALETELNKPWVSPALDPVKTSVTNFGNQLRDALLIQKGEIAATRTGSDKVEQARIKMCVVQYRNLGRIIANYAETPEFIPNYFDTVAIREGSQVIFTGDTKPGEFENIFKHTLAGGDELLLDNEGDAPLSFYFAAQKKDAPGTNTLISVPANSQRNVLRNDFGNITYAFLCVINTDTALKGKWVVELV